MRGITDVKLKTREKTLTQGRRLKSTFPETGTEASRRQVFIIYSVSLIAVALT